MRVECNGIKTPWYAHYEDVREHLEYPECSLYEMFAESAKKHSELISYNYFNHCVTYREFEAQIRKTAGALLAHGVKAGDVVSICMPNTPEAIMMFYAINRVGAVANMIHPLSAEAEIAHYIADTNSEILLVVDLAISKIQKIVDQTKLRHVIYVSPSESMPMGLKIGYKLTKQKKVKAMDARFITWKTFMKAFSGVQSVPVHSGKPEDTAVILYSGGTSGIPKGIALTNMNFCALAMQGVEACANIGERDRVLAIMPIFHGFGLGICIHTVQYMGGCSVILPSFSASTFDQLLKKYRPNIIAGVPTLYEAMLKNRKLDGVDLSFVKCIISGGDALSVSLKHKIDAFLKAHGTNATVREGYGLTECVTGSCMMPKNEYREGSIGIPYPDTFYKIVRPQTTEELPYGEEGEIVLCGPTVMKEYLGHEEETAQTLRVHEDGHTWLHTGDLGLMDEEGFLFFKQRLKRMIVSSGYNVYPQYIENVLDSHPAVLMSCVVGIPHPYKMQVAKAYVVLRNGYEASALMERSLRDLCEEKLAKYSWPVSYEFRAELPKTLVGKVAYTKLEEEASKEVENQAEAEA